MDTMDTTTADISESAKAISENDDAADGKTRIDEEADGETQLLGEVSPDCTDEKPDASQEELQVETLPLKEPSQPQHRSDAPRQTAPPKSYVNKFSYEPRPDEASYYQGLFNYVASFLKNKVDDTSEIVLPPKLVADKLFLASKIPHEKLRVIWNMATAVKPIESDDASIDYATEETPMQASPDVSPKSDEESKLNADVSVASAAASQMTKRSRSTVTWNEKGTLIVMTQPQFNTTVRLIQLFQNRTLAMDAQLKKIDKSKLPISRNGNKAKGAFMQRKLVKFDPDGLLPAYFAGISGVLLAVPGSIEYKAKGDNKLVPTNENRKNTQSNRRRTVDDVRSRAMKGGTRRRTVTGEMQNTGAHELRMKRMEKELIQLKTTVQLLQAEVRQLKILLPTRNRNEMARVKSTPHLISKQTREVVSHKKSESEARKPAEGLVHVTTQDEIDNDEPNTGVESYWGNRDEAEETKNQLSPADPSRKSRGTEDNKQASGRIVVREVLSFDPKMSMKMSSNIPAMHPSKRQTITGESKIQGSGSTNGSNSIGSGILTKLRSSVGSTGQTSAGMASSPGGDYNCSIQQLRASLGQKGQPTSDIRSNPKENFNNPLGRSQRLSAIKPDPQAGSSTNRSYPQPIHSQQQVSLNRRDHPRLSIASAATITTSNGSKNLKASITKPGGYARAGGAIRNNHASPDADKDESHSSRVSANRKTVVNTRKPRRLTRDSLTASIRHIVRNKDGSTQQYQEKEPPPSTNAVDVEPLEPAQLTASDILRTMEHGIKPKKKSSIIVRRLSSSSFPTS